MLEERAHLDGNDLAPVPPAVHGAEAALAHDWPKFQPRDGRLPLRLPLHDLRHAEVRGAVPIRKWQHGLCRNLRCRMRPSGLQHISCRGSVDSLQTTQGSSIQNDKKKRKGKAKDKERKENTQKQTCGTLLLLEPADEGAVLEAESEARMAKK